MNAPPGRVRKSNPPFVVQRHLIDLNVQRIHRHSHLIFDLLRAAHQENPVLRPRRAAKPKRRFAAHVHRVEKHSPQRASARNQVIDSQHHSTRIRPRPAGIEIDVLHQNARHQEAIRVALGGKTGRGQIAGQRAGQFHRPGQIHADHLADCRQLRDIHLPRARQCHLAPIDVPLGGQHPGIA